MNMIFRNIMICATGAMLLSGCSNQDNRHPLFVRAMRVIQAGDPEEGGKLLRAYLRINPDSAEAHKALGTVYDDRLDSPLLAVYHFRRYLECAPEAPDRSVVARWAESAEHRYYLRLKDSYNDPDDIRSLRYQLELAREQLRKEREKTGEYEQRVIRVQEESRGQFERLRAEKEKLQEELRARQTRIWDDGYLIGKLKSQLAESRKAETALSLENNLLKMKLQEATSSEAVVRQEDAAAPVAENDENVIAAVVEPPAATSPPPPAGFIVQPVFYEVRAGDNLIGIARKFYGSGRNYQRIIDANRNILSSPMDLRPGQVLEIPPQLNNQP